MKGGWKGILEGLEITEEVDLPPCLMGSSLYEIENPL